MNTRYRIYITEIEQDARPRRIRETVAVERLVRQAFGEGSRKYNLASGAPEVELPDGTRPVVSISHSATHAVLAVSPDGLAIGIDIEEFRPAMRRVVPKFLNDSEAAVCSGDEDLLKAWTLKEAAYKAASTPGLSLHDINLPSEGNLISLADGRKLRIFETTVKDGQCISVVGA